MADSPWPMHHGGPLGNGLSMSNGATNGQIKWFVELQKPGQGISIDSLGNLYLTDESGRLTSISKEGKLQWQIQLINNWVEEATTPLILYDGYIAVFLLDQFYLVQPTGDIILHKTLPGQIDMPTVQIDKEGDYFSIFNDGTLFSLTEAGDIRWTLTPPDSLEDNFWTTIGYPIWSPDGKYLYVSAEKNLYKITTDGNIEWFLPVTLTSPIVSDESGNIYYWDRDQSKVICLSKQGKIVWSHYLAGISIQEYSRPTITADGRIVFPIYQGIIAISLDGTFLWETQVPDGQWVFTELVSDIDGTVFFSTNMGSFYAIDKSGNIAWQVGNNLGVAMSPAIFNGIIIFGDQYGGIIYAIE